MQSRITRDEPAYRASLYDLLYHISQALVKPSATQVQWSISLKNKRISRNTLSRIARFRFQMYHMYDSRTGDVGILRPSTYEAETEMKKKTIVIIAIPLLILSLIVSMFAEVPDNHVRIACAIAELARPPKDAEVLQSEGWSTGFSNQSCFVFKASSEAIQEWIDQSPGLRALKPHIVSEDRSLIAFGSIDEVKKWEQAHPDKMLIGYAAGLNFVRRHERAQLPFELPQMQYYITPPGGISWFNPTITHGRIFRIRSYNCSVIIDDANNVVWVTASES